MTDEAEPGAETPRSRSVRLEEYPEYARWYTPGSLEERHFRLMRRINRITRLWRGQLEEALRPFGQTPARWEVLVFLALWGDGATQVSLAKRMEIEGPSLVRMLDKLEEDGLVERVASDTDRRAKLIHLTPAGVDLVGRLIASTNAARAELLSDLSEEEVDQATAVLNVILGRLER